jgi:L-proline amide hydrolase
VLYDQLGCGSSRHLPDAPADFWTPQLFKDELSLLATELGIADRYAVVGQSWGGMLAMEHALDHPDGLRAIVVADSPASIPLWVEEANRLRRDLPADVQETLARHEEAGTTDDPAYEEAVRVFYDRHLCRLDPWPDCVDRSFAKMAADPTVYHTMNGPSEFHCIGSLKTWDITDRLHEITTPTLLISGRYDEATPHIVEQIHTRIPGAQWELFEQSSHMPHVEEPEAFLERVEGFLRTVD